MTQYETQDRVIGMNSWLQTKLRQTTRIGEFAPYLLFPRDWQLRSLDNLDELSKSVATGFGLSLVLWPSARNHTAPIPKV